MNIKIRLLQLGKTQVDLLSVLRKRGFPNLQAPYLSVAIRHVANEPQAVRIREMADVILKEWEEKEAK